MKATVRWAKEDLELDDQRIRTGERLLLSLAAANRDPEQFEDPDALDLNRSPNHHVAFAQGIHVCIGAPLARLEAQETSAGLTARLPRPQLEVDQPEYFRTVVGRALKNLSVSR